MRLVGFAVLMLLAVGCTCNCQPTVELMSSTIKTLREEDYEKGFVSYPGDEGNSKKLVDARIEMLKAAENNAAVLLKKDPPHKLEAEEKGGESK